MKWSYLVIVDIGLSEIEEVVEPGEKPGGKRYLCRFSVRMNQRIDGFYVRF